MAKLTEAERLRRADEKDAHTDLQIRLRAINDRLQARGTPPLYVKYHDNIPCIYQWIVDVDRQSAEEMQRTPAAGSGFGYVREWLQNYLNALLNVERLKGW